MNFNPDQMNLSAGWTLSVLHENVVSHIWITSVVCLGVTVTTVDESTYEIFAPNADALKEAKEMMSSWMETKVLY